MITFDSLDLPIVLAQPDTEQGWVRTREARWPDLVVALGLQWQAVHDVTEACDTFAAAVKELQPIMEAHPSMTVAEALMVLGKAS
jgi:hypothetical protein